MFKHLRTIIKESEQSHTHTHTSMYMHTSNTIVHIQCEVIHDNTWVRDVHFMLSQVQMSKVYKNSCCFASV
jgi:hypothetical protein